MKSEFLSQVESNHSCISLCDRNFGWEVQNLGLLLMACEKIEPVSVEKTVATVTAQAWIQFICALHLGVGVFLGRFFSLQSITFTLTENGFNISPT